MNVLTVLKHKIIQKTSLSLHNCSYLPAIKLFMDMRHLTTHSKGHEIYLT